MRQIHQLWSCIKLLPYYNLPMQKIPMRKYCLCQNIFTRCVDLKTHTNCSPRLKKWGKKFEIENIFQWFLLVREPQTILHFYFAMFLINKCVSVFKRQNVWKLYINCTWKIVSNLKKLSSPLFQMKIIIFSRMHQTSSNNLSNLILLRLAQNCSYDTKE